MDDIFNRWIEQGKLEQNDIVPIMLEYVTVFEKGIITPEQCLIFLQVLPIPIAQFLDNCLKQIAVKKQLDIIEVYDRNGIFIRRFWNHGLSQENK